MRPIFLTILCIFLANQVILSATNGIEDANVANEVQQPTEVSIFLEFNVINYQYQYKLKRNDFN